MTNPEIKLSDALFDTAQAVRQIAKKAGIDLYTTQIYNKETLEQLALVSGFIIQLAEKAANQKIEITKS